MKKKFANILFILTLAERRLLWILIVLNLVISIADIGALALLLLVINFYLHPSGPNHLDFLPGWLLKPDSVALITVFLFFFAIKNLVGYFISASQNKFVSRVAIRISQNNLENYQQSGFEEFISIDSSTHIRKIAFQPFEFCQYILSGIQQIIIQSFLILITVVAILIYNTKLFLLLFFILLPPVIVVFYFLKKRLTVAKHHIQTSNERSFQYLLDALKGYVEGNIYNRNDFFLQRFIRARKKFSEHLFESITIQNMPNRIIEIFAVLGLFILIAIAKWSGNNDSATLITIGAFIAAAYKIIPGIVKIINTSGQMKAYEFSISDLMTKSNPGEKEALAATAVVIDSLEMRNISFQYGDHRVLNNFSFSINKGDFIGISGESGKGKTTILNLLLGFLKPDNGEIIINDLSLRDEEIKKFWPSIAYVRQQAFFIYDTILRNITLEESEPDQEKLQYSLATSGLDKFISKFPEGIDKLITENGKNISGGQQQRVALARALYKRAQLVLLDEPFNELDEASAVLLVEHFRELSSDGKIVIMVTHDKKSLSYCNKIISLDES